MIDNKIRAKHFQDKKIIGIDPGKSGGITVYSVDEGKVIECIKMLATPLDVYNFFNIYKNNSICYLEKVQGLPGMGGASMFTFGRGYGHLEMALLALKIPTVSVTPQKWQKALQLGTKGKQSNTQWKNKLKAKAQQLFPYVKKITLAMSDSLLITEYARLAEKV